MMDHETGSDAIIYIGPMKEKWKSLDIDVEYSANGKSRYRRLKSSVVRTSSYKNDHHQEGRRGGAFAAPQQPRHNSGRFDDRGFRPGYNNNQPASRFGANNRPYNQRPYRSYDEERDWNGPRNDQCDR